MSSKIYHGNRIVDATIGLSHLKQEVSDFVTNGGTNISGLTTSGSTLTLITSKGNKTVDLMPAIQQLVTPQNNFPQLFTNSSFDTPFDNGGVGTPGNGWYTGSDPTNVNKPFISGGTLYIDAKANTPSLQTVYQKITGLTIGATYGIIAHGVQTQGVFLFTTLNHGDSPIIALTDGIAPNVLTQWSFVATTTTETISLATGAGGGAIASFYDVTIQGQLTQNVIDINPSLLNRLSVSGSTLVAVTNNGNKLVNLMPAVSAAISGGSVSVNVSNDTLDVNLGGVVQNIPLERFSPYRQKVGRQLLGDPDFNLPLSPNTTPLLLNVWTVANGGWSITDGKAIGVNAGFLYQEFFTTSGSSYQVVVDVESVSGVVYVGWSDIPTTPFSIGINTFVTNVVNPNSRTRFHLYGEGTGSAVIKSVTVTEVMGDASLTTPDRVTNLSLSGKTLTLATDKVTKSVDLSPMLLPLVINANGNIGIGTSGNTPTQKLDVASGNIIVRGINNYAAVGDEARLYFGDTNHSISGIAGLGVRLSTNLVLNGIFLQQVTGHVGIGTGNPLYKLQISAGENQGVTTALGESTEFGNPIWSFKQANVNYTAIGFAVGSSPIAQVNVPEALVIQRTGNVGIGTTAPESKLTVQGVVHSGIGGFKFPDNTVQISSADTVKSLAVVIDQVLPTVPSGYTGFKPGDFGNFTDVRPDIVLQGMTVVNTAYVVGNTPGAYADVTFYGNSISFTYYDEPASVGGIEILRDGIGAEYTAFAGAGRFIPKLVLFEMVGIHTLRIRVPATNSGGVALQSISINVTPGAEQDRARLQLTTDKGVITGDVTSLYSRSAIHQRGLGINSIQPGSNNLTFDDNQASGNRSAVFSGLNNKATGGFSVIAGGLNNLVTSELGAILGGVGNVNNGARSVIVGGEINRINGAYSVISGGWYHTIDGNQSTISGGKGNSVGAEFATIGGGTNNYTNQAFSVIAGGQNNRNEGINSTIGGGQYQQVQGASATIAGGDGNKANNTWSTVGGGAGNNALGIASGVFSGTLNIGNGAYSFVGGGNGNSAEGVGATISGGVNNKTYPDWSTVGGGSINHSYGQGSTVGGGYTNLAGAHYSIVAGGIYNTAQGYQSSIGGGNNNKAMSDSSVIGGGFSNIVFSGATHSSILGGDSNSITDMGSYSTIAGGRVNTATNPFSVIVGGQHNQAGSIGAVAEAAYEPLFTVGGHFLGGGQNNRVRSIIYGTIAGGARNTVSGDYAFVGGGIDNKATGIYSATLGGDRNTASAQWGTVAGGVSNNVLNGFAGFIGAGFGNTIYGSGNYNIIGAGYANNLTGNVGALMAGFGNNMHGSAGFIGAGVQNTITAAADNSVLGGGNGNTINGVYGFIGGGQNNIASTGWATVAGGISNTALALRSTINGGNTNTIYITGDNSTISGGNGNSVRGVNSYLGGGNSNRVESGFSAVAGGQLNVVTGDFGFIGGGENNFLNGLRAVIGGGENNSASGTHTFVGGGVSNKAMGMYSAVVGGAFNTANGNYVTIFGGSANTVNGEFGSTDGNNNMASGYDNHAYGCTSCTIPAGTERITLVNCQNFTAPMVNYATYINNVLYAPSVVEATAVKTTGHTLTLTDAGRLVPFSVAANCVIPLHSLVPFPIGTVIEIAQEGTGQVTITTADPLITLRLTTGPKTSGQWASIGLRQRSIDEWVVTNGTF